MKLVMNRNLTVISLSGHAIRFEKNVPVEVPSAMVAEAMQKGAVPENPEELESEQEQQPVPPPVGDARTKAFYEVFELLVAENARSKFTGAGVPRVDEVRRLLDFEVDAKELQTAWEAFRAGE